MAWTEHQLTKSRLIAWRQCQRKLWLQTHRPELAAADESSQAVMDAGSEFSEVARRLFGEGEVVDIRMGAQHCVEKTRELMAAGAEHIFEAAFQADDTLVLVDVFERTTEHGKSLYRAVEVKSSTTVKEVYLDDCAIQSYILQRSIGADVQTNLGLVNSQFVYLGDGEYEGLLSEIPVDEQIAERRLEVGKWITSAKGVVLGPEPKLSVGPHCHIPYDCPFFEHCNDRVPVAYPVSSLPYASKLAEALAAEGYLDIREVPESRLAKPLHQRVRQVVINQQPFLDPAAAAELSRLGWPRYYLDFETISFVVPIWKGTKPFQQLPFQWSMHVEHKDGRLEHHDFLDLSGASPTLNSMTQLIARAGSSGPIFVYSAFEKRILNEMAREFPQLDGHLQTLIERLFDLLPLARQYFYHPQMHGSWSIKKVLPTVAPELSYDSMRIGNGGAAQEAYRTAIAPSTSHDDRQQLRKDLLDYCRQDTLAMVKLRNYFSAGA